MAAPHVSGVAALVLSRFPGYTRQELFDILVNSVDPVLFDKPVGAGRLNSFLAVRTDQPPPKVRLSVPPTLSGRQPIVGTAYGSFFIGYTLRAGSGTYPKDWIELASATSPITNAVAGVFDSSRLPDGFATVQLIVTNQNGLTASSSASVRLLNALITTPLSGDILAPGIFPVLGTVFGEGKSYELSFGSGLAPKNWISVSSGVATEAPDSPLGVWDARSLPSGFYSLRLQVNGGAAGPFEFSAPAVYIDHDLHPGWPAYLPVDRDFPLSDWRNIRVADLDGDGLGELILVDPGNHTRPQVLRVYSMTGKLLWSRTLGFDIPPDLPAIGDVDGDGKSEIFVDSTNGITAFRYDGTPLGEGWPVPVANNNTAKVLADLDGDGRLELIAYSQEYFATQVGESRELSVFRADGTLLRKWTLPWCGFTNTVQKIFPAVANLDSDPELEIVAVSGCQEIAAFDFRQDAPKWRASTRSPVLCSPVIGDIDGRGGPDIVVAAAAENGASEGGVYVFDGQGQLRLGWPVLEEFSFTTAPALGDLDQDGRLEIVLASIKPPAIHLLQWDGFEAEGWPLTNNFASWDASVGVADADGDGHPDAIVTAPGYENLALLFEDYRYVGGVGAYDFSAKEVRLSGNDRFNPRLLESSTAVWHRAGPAVFTDLDGDGKMDLVTASVLDRTYGTYTKIKERSSLYAWKLNVPISPERIPWPMFGHDPRNSGAYSLPPIPISPPTNEVAAIRDRILTLEDREVLIEPLLNDYGENLHLVGFSGPTNGSVSLQAPGMLLYRPATNFFGFDGFSYWIANSKGLMSTGRVFLKIKPVNDRPVVRDLSLEMTKNTSLDFFFEGEDAENDPLRFRVIASPANGEVWNYPTVGEYVPRKGFHGVDSFRYVANDGKEDSDPATIQVTVININNPPHATEAEWLTKTNRPLRISLTGEDPDDDPLTFELVTMPRHGSLEPDRTLFIYTPDRDFLGDDSFTFRAFDGTEFGEPAAIKIGVIATNATPRASDGSLAVQPNSSSSLRLSGTDPDGDPIHFTVLTLPLHGELTGEAPDLTYTPAKDYLGPDRFTFKVTDSFAESEVATFNIQVARENRPPVAQDQTVMVRPGSSAPIILDAFDPDGDPIQTIILKGPAHGLLYGVGRNQTYVPGPFFSGADQFTYKLWDGQKFGSEGRVSINVQTPPEDHPFRFESLVVHPDFVELRVRPGSWRTFTIEASTNLADWGAIAGPRSASFEVESIADTNQSGARRYYRAVGR